tara:strand:+ start:717 stop:1004 length:288 start_codon:yes stop_codon:yes gene_type:complete
MNTAMQVCTATLRQRDEARAKRSGNSYVLYYSNDQERYSGKLQGTTIKALIQQFREMGGNYQYAVITKKDDVTPMRYFNREVSKKFFSMTRKKKK